MRTGRRLRILEVAALLALLALPISGSLGQVPPVGAAQGACFGYNGVDDSFIPGIASSLRVAVVMPVFTSTPYSQYNYGSFYAFYTKYANAVGNITTDLDWLSTNVSSGLGYYRGWGLSNGLYQFLSSQTASGCGLTLGGNVRVLSDVNVSEGALYGQGGSPRFDVVVLPFSEYETASEMQAYQRFVAGGGTIVMPASHSIEWPVVYDPATGMETFTQGHNFAWNGRTAWRISCGDKDFPACPWAENYTDWVASNPIGSVAIKYNGSVTNADDVIGRALGREFGSVVFKTYKAHEENVVTNMTGTSIISTFATSANQTNGLVASYVHDYGKGRVVCMCVFGDDIIATDQSAQYFLLLGIISASLYPQVACSAPTGSASSTCTVTLKGWDPTGTVSWTSDGRSSIEPATCQLSGGSCSVTVSASEGSSLLTVSYGGDSQNAPSSSRFSFLGAPGAGRPTGTQSASSTSLAASSAGGATSSNVEQGGAGSLELVGAAAVAVVAVAALGGVFLRRRR